MSSLSILYTILTVFFVAASSASRLTYGIEPSGGSTTFTGLAIGNVSYAPAATAFVACVNNAL